LDGLKEASENIKKLDDCYADCLSFYHHIDFNPSLFNERPNTSIISLPERIKGSLEGIDISLEEDLNISSALSHLLIGVHFINQALSQRRMNMEHFQLVLDLFKKMDRLFGFDITAVDLIPKEILKMVRERDELRRKKDFQQTDRLRREIEALGWLVKDGRPGEPSTVKKKRRTWD